jgi:hypothetical protein
MRDVHKEVADDATDLLLIALTATTCEEHECRGSSADQPFHTTTLSEARSPDKVRAARAPAGARVRRPMTLGGSRRSPSRACSDLAYRTPRREPGSGADARATVAVDGGLGWWRGYRRRPSTREPVPVASGRSRARRRRFGSRPSSGAQRPRCPGGPRPAVRGAASGRRAAARGRRPPPPGGATDAERPPKGGEGQAPNRRRARYAKHVDAAIGAEQQRRAIERKRVGVGPGA